MSLSQMMEIVSTPRHSAKLGGSFVTSAPGYGRQFLERIAEVTGGKAFWKPKGG